MISVVGDIRVPRRYYYCRRCRRGFVPMDQWAGLDATHLTPRGRRLVVLAGSDFSFDRASDRLWRMCGVRVSDQTVRRASQASGDQARAYLEQSDRPVEQLKAAPGQSECTMDGAKVNTVDGWREIRALAISKRQKGEPADLRHWDDRVLPGPECCWSWAGIADASQVGEQLHAMAKRLDWRQGQDISALADGAPWIWNQCDQHLPEHEGVLDVYHMLEHLHAAGRVVCGEGQPAQRWAEKQRAKLFRLGPKKYLHKHLLPLVKRHRQQNPKSLAAQELQRLLGYLWRHRERLHYRDRLRRGLPIGSGQIEGICKNTLNSRLRINNPRWRPENVDRMAALLCLHRSDQWDEFWEDQHSQAA